MVRRASIAALCVSLALGVAASAMAQNEYYGIDVRASKSIRISADRRVELIAQVFNLLNRTNLLAAWQTNALSSTFGTSVSAANMRQAEVAVRLSF